VEQVAVCVNERVERGQARRSPGYRPRSS
jgi:hypothetical protein